MKEIKTSSGIQKDQQEVMEEILKIVQKLREENEFELAAKFQRIADDMVLFTEEDIKRLAELEGKWTQEEYDET